MREIDAEASGNGESGRIWISLVQRPEHIEVYLFTLKKASEFSQVARDCRNLLADLRGHTGGIKFVPGKQGVQWRRQRERAGIGLRSNCLQPPADEPPIQNCGIFGELEGWQSRAYRFYAWE